MFIKIHARRSRLAHVEFLGARIPTTAINKEREGLCAESEGDENEKINRRLRKLAAADDGLDVDSNEAPVVFPSYSA